MASSGQINQIDSYLKGKGSPLAGQGAVFVSAGKKYSVDPKLVVAISGAESGFGKHLFAPFNAWGWMSGDKYANWAHSINAVTKGLGIGYIQQGLTTPATIVGKYAPAKAGNDESVWSGNVSTFMRELGAAPAASMAKVVSAPPKASGVPTASTSPDLSSIQSLLTQMQAAPPSSAGLRSAAMTNLSRIAQTGYASPASTLSSLSGGIQQDRATDAESARYTSALHDAIADLQASYQPPVAAATAVTPAAPPGVDATAPYKAGFPVQGGTGVGGEHGTSGLAGYTGKDYFAPAGSKALAPISGKVVRLSGHDPSLGAVQGPGGPLGWSLYIQGDDGRTYYLTHMGSRSVVEGDTVKAGQPIGTVADYDSFGRPSHIHMGYIAT